MNLPQPTANWPSAHWLDHWRVQYVSEARSLSSSSANASPSCGPDLEYDPEFLAFQRAWQGRPETQFEPAVPPDYSQVIELAEGLLERSLDLRLVLGWADGRLNRYGWSELANCLQIIAEVLKTFWPGLNPLDDEGDYYPRWNALELLGPVGPLVKTVRNLTVLDDPIYGSIKVKDFQSIVAGGATQQGLDRSALAARIASQTDWLREARGQAEQALAHCEELAQLIGQLSEQYGASSTATSAELLADLRALLESILQLAPRPQPAQPAQSTHQFQISGAGVTPELPSTTLDYDALQTQVQNGSVYLPTSTAQQGAFSAAMPINNRAQAIAAIEAVCAYLRVAEPSNPAQQLLQRARQVIDKDFLQVLHTLLPDSLNEAARLLGVDPEQIRSDS